LATRLSSMPAPPFTSMVLVIACAHEHRPDQQLGLQGDGSNGVVGGLKLLLKPPQILHLGHTIRPPDGVYLGCQLGQFRPARGLLINRVAGVRATTAALVHGYSISIQFWLP